MTKNERLELNALSKKVFGTSSKWQKVMRYGEKVPTKIKFKSGKEIDGFTYAYPTVEQIRMGLENRAEEMDKHKPETESKV